MTVPSWVRIGAKCVCIDDAWRDIFDTGSPGPFPQKDEVFTIAGTISFDGEYFLVVAETHVASDYYAVSAFRPLTPLESDVQLFSFAFKGGAASPRREQVPA